MVPSWIASRALRQSALFLIAAAALFAQSERGTISGTVRDSSGAAVPQAQVAITSTATNQATNVTSGASGEFTAPEMAVGTYDVRVEKTGFRPAQMHGLTVNAATTARADFSLEIGQSRQVIEVEAAAVQLNSEDSKSSVTINQKLVDTLPLVVGGAVRSPFDLATLTPGIQERRRRRRLLPRWRASVPATAPPSTAFLSTRHGLSRKVGCPQTRLRSKHITEFTVDTNGFKAEYGHAGGGVMTLLPNREPTNSTAPPTSSCATTISTPTISLATAPVNPVRYTSKTILAPP